MHVVSIEAGGIVPLPRVGGALSHAVGSIRTCRGPVKPGFARTSRFGTGLKAQGKDGRGQVFAGQAASCRMSWMNIGSYFADRSKVA
jgi:hypothetical protein